MAKAAMKKILGHLWYLPEELEYFAFFDDELSVQDKNYGRFTKNRIPQKEKALKSNTSPKKS